MRLLSMVTKFYETKLYGADKICIYDLLNSTEHTLSSGSMVAGNPDIHDNRVVWADVRRDSSYNVKYDIYLYDLSTSTTTKITDVSASESANTPEIYGNKIVWEYVLNGNSDVYMCTISEDISEPPILSVASFNINATSGIAPFSVQFNDTSTGSPTSWNWNFGDKTTSTNQNTTHTYSAAGTFTVNLTASNGNGTNSKTVTINVLPAPLKTPLITWSNPADIIYGTALSSTQLNAVASVPGTFVLYSSRRNYTE